MFGMCSGQATNRDTDGVQISNSKGEFVRLEDIRETGEPPLERDRVGVMCMGGWVRDFSELEHKGSQ